MKNTFYSSLFTSLYILNVNAHPHGLRVHLGSCLLGKNGAVLIRKYLGMQPEALDYISVVYCAAHFG